MPKPKKTVEREERIENEIIVDAHDSEEQAMGWYSYLEENLYFPFTAKCVAEREISLLEKGDGAEVLDMASEDACQHEMFVTLPYKRRELAVPLSQLKPVASTDKDTKEAVADWHYWIDQGYML